MTRGPQGAPPPDLSTWKNAAGIPISGGGTWTSYTPRSEDRTSLRPRRQPGSRLRDRRARGENLYTDSVVVLDAKTGDYKYHFKLVPKDWHDWDVSTRPS